MDAGEEIIHNREAKRFQTQRNSESAFVAYESDSVSITLTRTFVAPELRGRALAARLVAAALDYARAQGLQVKSRCSYVDRFLQIHADYADLYAP